MAIKSPNSLKFFIEQCLMDLQTSFKKIMLLSINKKKVVILQTYIEAVPQSKHNNDNASFLSDTTLCTDTHLRTKRKKSLPTSASIKFRALFWRRERLSKSSKMSMCSEGNHTSHPAPRLSEQHATPQQSLWVVEQCLNLA